MDLKMLCECVDFIQCRRHEEKSVQITGARRSGRGPAYVSYVFVFSGSIIVCRLYKLTLSDQAKVTLHLTVSLSDSV
jgi:hypothetical protein